MRIRELFDLHGRVAIVTGGATGLGRQLAEALADCGADLVLCARRAERCEEAAANIASTYGVRALGLRCNVADPAEVEAVVERSVGELGRLDILVNNAGTSWGAAPEEVPLSGWRKVLDVNLTGTFLFSQAVGRVLIDQRQGGTIVNVTSITAYRGEPPEVMNALPYNASKGGVVSLTIDLAVKWAPHGIRVNALAPGWFPSGMAEHVLEEAGEQLLRGIPLGRFGGPDDLKGAIAFLASRASGFVTGTTLVVDGGQLAG